MIRVLLFVSLCVILPRVLAEPTADVFMRAQLINAEGEVAELKGIKVGQRVTLAVDIYTDTWFTRAPELEPLSVAGAISLQAQGFGINYSERLNGVRYAVQRRELNIFPKRAGQFIVPSQSAKVWVAGENGLAGDALSVRSDPLVFQATGVITTAGDIAVTDGANPLRVLVANELNIEERFEPSLAQLTSGEKPLRAGDAVVRRVTLTAKGTLGMLINPMIWPIVDDVAQQARRVKVSDRTARGEFTGVRQESRSYVFEREGQYQLPAQDVQWWDAENQRLVTSTLAAHTLTVLPSALAVSDEYNPVEESPLPKGWLKALAALLATVLATTALGYFVLNAARKLMGAGRTLVQVYKNSHVYARRQLLRACKRGDKALIVRHFYRWQQRLPAGVLETQLGAELQAALTDFYQVYYLPAGDSTVAVQRLAGSVKSIARQDCRFKVTMPRGRALVDLNPR